MTFTFRGRQVYYESHGQGRPLLFLNGIMMSCASWAPFVDAFTGAGYRLLLMDLMDQGKTAAFEEGYRTSDQAEMVSGLIRALGLGQVDIMGTSYGGAVALELAIQYPEQVGRLMLAATRAWTDPLFSGMCESWLHAVHSPQALYTATIPLFYGATFQQQQPEWLASRRRLLEKTAFASADFLARFTRLVRSILDLDLRARLKDIKAPTLVLAPEEDLVMLPWENRRIADGITGAQLMTLYRTGHVLILERPELFVSLVKGWFSPVSPVALP